MKEGQAEYEKAHQAAIANFSPEAKEADAKMTAIADDPNLSGVEKRDQIKAVMDCKCSISYKLFFRSNSQNIFILINYSK